MTFLAQIPTEQLLHQLESGVILMILGLSTVFVFLTLLVFLTKGTSALARRFAPAATPAAVAAHGPIHSVPASASDAEVAAAIVAAFAKSKE
ncbi:MAG: OadG family protein [Sphaerochaeta sp.]|jgi:oxaloacetate decarboxylase gamma subunit|nr:OadG family protein [Sphaerochaeta sp.]